MTPEQKQIIMELKSISIARYELDRRQEQLLQALEPMQKPRRKVTDFKAFLDAARKRGQKCSKS